MSACFYKIIEDHQRSDETDLFINLNIIYNLTETDKIKRYPKYRNHCKYCFSWSILAYLHPCENSHPSRVRNYIQYFNELNSDGFDFTNGFECSDVHKIEKLKTLFKNNIELFFYQDQNKWKQN